MAGLFSYPQSDQPLIGVPQAPQRRPGIRTAVYRTDPGTREFLLDESGYEAPGARARLEDQLGYNQQKMESLQGAGATFENSPQLRGMMATHESGWKALNDQMAAQAEQSKAQTAAGALAWEQSPENFRQRALGSQIQAGTALPSAMQGAGLQVSPEAMATETGLDKSNSLIGALSGLRAKGVSQITPGSAEHTYIAGKFGPELQARMAGEPYHWYETPQWYENPVPKLLRALYGGLENTQMVQQMFGQQPSLGSPEPSLPLQATEPALPVVPNPKIGLLPKKKTKVGLRMSDRSKTGGTS